ncbi:phenylalanine--tRNA ligase subunit beta [Sulfobacillus thermosulfidooxidans]|uniref:phenylalanine--tRNA ligase subunit beta n=1 Tax=Sulfobacillus thermosulfidooxidans TaxID=28034 RepID=UPI0006B53802|nr:phenylalanine--tRNA ligase subunit beta [Sulfobacillus thermosulfidooxidans]
MIVSYRWLKRYVPALPSPQFVADKLTQLGWEIVSQETWGTWYQPVELVEIINRIKHPNADHLSVVTIRRQNHPPIDVVTGARNGMIGDHVWYAPVGTHLIDGRILENVNMRGINSPGMLLSAEELGFQAGEQDLWIWDGTEPLGTHFIDVIGGLDTVFEVELTPNLAVFGQSMRAMARDLAAAFDLPWHSELSEYIYDDAALASVENREDCPLYGLVDFQIEPGKMTPLWLQVLLRSIGQRVIYPAVDITNFLLWDIGQPLHAFDADKVRGQIHVRRAFEGERLLTLDGVDRQLTPMDLVIADDRQALALAGVMGGSATAVSRETTHILLESAHFNPSLIFQTMRRHQIFSDAALHFGKGTNPEAVYTAPRLYQDLLQDMGILQDIGPSQVLGTRPKPRHIPFYPEAIRRLLGVQWSDEQIAGGLRRLGFVQDGHDIVVPLDRHDVEGSHDLAEEVARLYGLDEIPTTIFSSPARPGQRSDEVAYHELIKNSLVAAGYWEVITRSFTSKARILRAGLEVPEDIVAVANPLREEESLLRFSLLPGLLETIETNRARRDVPLSLFELAPVYVKGDQTQWQYEELAVVQTLEETLRYPKNYAPHLLDLKGVMEWMNERCALGLTWKQVTNGPQYMHPGRLLALYATDGTLVGYLGEIRPRIAQQYHAKRIGAWIMRVPKTARYHMESHIAKPLRYPEVVRDLSLIVPSTVSYDEIWQASRRLDTDVLRSVAPIDHYYGDFGESWTLRLVFQSAEKTLTDEEVDGLIAAFLHHLRPLGITMRQ